MMNKEVTEAIQKVAAAYDCKIVEEFEENEVYAIDIVTSSGDGKPKLLDERQTTIYKRAVDKNYHLNMKSSRFIFSEISQKFPIMPFTGRALEEKRARLGLVECVNHDLLQPYPVLHEKPDRITSHALLELQPSKTINDARKSRPGKKGDKSESSQKPNQWTQQQM
ncbi:hypothetical protein HHK36_010705 [Tetracentron sinense]|uniref:Uncharacterized protein n=1 Tax=Tetracentron sinense TaxID=13715 RepID=A0A835DGN8_TETSI|nr:hypothetical protein HHK36_010705 [Tetracentron sinense]